MEQKSVVNRRNFLAQSSVVGLSSILLPGVSMAQSQLVNTTAYRPKVLLFDVNETILDLKAMKTAFIKLVNGRTELLPLWFTTMLQYSMVSTVGRHYDDFGTVGGAALRMVAANNGIKITEQQSVAFMKNMESLPAHPEVKDALSLLQAEGFKMVSFTNSTYAVVKNQLKIRA